jgi:hypothetical protein
MENEIKKLKEALELLQSAKEKLGEVDMDLFEDKFNEEDLRNLACDTLTDLITEVEILIGEDE